MQTRLKLILNQASTFASAATLVFTLFLPTPAWSQSSTPPGETRSPLGVASAHPLDGRKFSARIVRDDADSNNKNPPLGDILSFSNGKFSSEICRRYNFTDAPYWIRVEGDQVHFLAELKSPTDGTMLWKGTVRGDTLEGTMQWTKERWYWTINAKHRIRGELQKGALAAPPPAN
jgi:hypothetical protein